MRAGGRLVFLGLVLEAAVTAANPPPPYNPPANLPPQSARPLGPPPRSYPPSWYYDPYTQGIAGLPQKGGD